MFRTLLCAGLFLFGLGHAQETRMRKKAAPLVDITSAESFEQFNAQNPHRMVLFYSSKLEPELLTIKKVLKDVPAAVRKLLVEDNEIRNDGEDLPTDPGFATVDCAKAPSACEAKSARPFSPKPKLVYFNDEYHVVDKFFNHPMRRNVKAIAEWVKYNRVVVTKPHHDAKQRKDENPHVAHHEL